MIDLEARLRDQALMCREYGSPLTAALLEGAAEDLVAGGVVADLLGPHASDPSGTVPALRFAGSLHRLVLEGRAAELAEHYPSVGGTASPDELWPAAERACREQLPRLRELLHKGVQTNEVGRSAVLYGVLLLQDGPVHLLEIGASAGLNLRCDSFAYALGMQVLGDPSSPVRLVEPWQGPPPPTRTLEVHGRKGCDPRPLDPLTEDGRLTLMSYVWADQVERLERLRGACDVARRVPATVETAHAVDFLRRELAQRPRGITTVVWHSAVWQYVDPEERRAVEALLEEHGRAADPDSPLVRASMEPERVDGRWAFRVRLQRWPGGRVVHVADSNGHGPPVRWTGASMEP